LKSNFYTTPKSRLKNLESTIKQFNVFIAKVLDILNPTATTRPNASAVEEPLFQHLLEIPEPFSKMRFCGGNHPANYRGCPIHKEFQSALQSKRKISQSQNNPISHYTNVKSNLNSVLPKSYAQATNESTNGQSKLPSSI